MTLNKLLLVDDDANILRSLSRVFAEEEYSVFTASDGSEALEVMRRVPIDLIISDQKMPGMSGLEFLEKTMDDYPDVIRIILTGHAELNDAIRAINSGSVYKFILKPWNNDDLKVTVKRALEQRNLILQNRELTSELKKRDRILEELEKEHPGITRRPKGGIYEIKTSKQKR